MRKLTQHESDLVVGGTQEQANAVADAMAATAAVAAVIPGGQGVAFLLFVGAAGIELGAAL